MKRLIKRYVLKAQVDKENDEVNEGKPLPREARPLTTNVINVENSMLKITLKVPSQVTAWVLLRSTGESYVAFLKCYLFKEIVIKNINLKQFISTQNALILRMQGPPSLGEFKFPVTWVVSLSSREWYHFSNGAGKIMVSSDRIHVSAEESLHFFPERKL